MINNLTFRPLIFAGLIAVDFWLLNYIAARLANLRGYDLGTLGDSFGMVNALFSSAAVAGAIYAVILQQRQFNAADARENSLAELQAVSAYSQCLASCAMLTYEKSKDLIGKFDELAKTAPSAPDLSNVDPREHATIVETYQERIRQTLELHSLTTRAAVDFHEISVGYLTALTDSLHALRQLPIVASKIPHPVESAPVVPPSP